MLTSSRVRPGPALAILAALALVACVAALVSSRLAPLPGTGFQERVTPGAHCDGEPRTSTVREPFVPHDDSAPRCVTWTASFVARSKMRGVVQTMTQGFGSIAIDGHAVVSDDSAAAAHEQTGTLDLAAGVHSFVASFTTHGGPAYFRVAMEDQLDPHDVSIIAPLDEDAFFIASADAKAALEGAPRARPVWSALVAALALAAAGLLTWLAIRARRGLAVPRADLLIAAAIFGVALFVRAHALVLQDRCWDELSYVNPGLHYVRNVVLGDYFAEAWRYTAVHPPNTKWVLGLGATLGGLDGARVFAGVMGSVAASFLFAFGRMTFGRGVGALAGSLFTVLPLLAAHGRVAGHESMVLFWWCGAMLAFACWARSRAESLPRGDSLAAFICCFAATAGVFTRATAVWIYPVLLLAWLVETKGPARERLRSFPYWGAAGIVAGVALALAMFPFLWSGQAEKFARVAAVWGQKWGDIEVYMGKLRLPAPHYFLVAFLSETPALLLAAALAGILLALRPGPRRRWGMVCLIWLVIPFAQSVSTLRIGAGRYVIQSWPALLLFASVALVALGERIAALAAELPKGARAALVATPGILAVLYTAVALGRVEPYPLDYFNELVGGPAGVAARRMFEVPWWGEGNLAAIRGLNQIATKGARVHLALWPVHSIARLRDDLVPVAEPTAADYVLVSHLQYFAKPPAGCERIGTIDVEGAPLVDTFHCNPASRAQAGFAAMTRGAPDEAIPLFREALQRDPHDPAALFGLGWAAQVKGNVRDAESFYVQAAARAAQTNDLETEYFSRFDLGTLFAQEGRSDDAVTAFRSVQVVVERDPPRFADRLWSIWLNLGRALAASGHPGDARAALDRARVLRPNDPAIADAFTLLTPRIVTPTPISSASASPSLTSSDPPGARPRR